MHACGELEACLNGVCVGPGCPDRIVYVSAAGSDLESGCYRDRPRKTISSAASFIQKVGADAHEIHVCEGMYVENVFVDSPLAIRGGYDCATWLRRDDGKESVVAGVPGAAAMTVNVDTPAFVLDRMTLIGSDTDLANVSTGLLLVDGASASVVDSTIRGGGGTGQAIGSKGIHVGAGSRLVLERSTVSGGSGTASLVGNGSVGIFSQDGAAEVRIDHCHVDGGSGRAPGGTGSTGILLGWDVQSAFGGPMTHGIFDSTIDGGTGSQGGGIAVVAISASVPGAIDIVGNTITGGDGTCNEGDCGSAGIVVGGGELARIHGNRIYGGDAIGAASGGTYVGIDVSSSGADIQDNEIHAGNGKRRPAVVATAARLHLSAASFVANNTFVAPSGVGDGPALQLQADHGRLVVAGNLIAGAFDPVSLRTCSDGAFTLQDNAFLGAADGSTLLDLAWDSIRAPATCNTNQFSSAASVAEAEALLVATYGGDTGGNVRVSSSCSSDVAPRCLALCPSAFDVRACLARFYGSWDPASAGGGLLATGWRLAPNPPCAIARGAASLNGTLAQDLFGTARTAPPSIGAEEYDGACTP